MQSKIHYIQLQIAFVKQLAEKRAFWAPQPFDVFHISTFEMKSVVPQTFIPFFSMLANGVQPFIHIETLNTGYVSMQNQHKMDSQSHFFFKYKQSNTIQFQARPTNTCFIVTNCCQDAFRHIAEFQLYFTCLGKKGYYSQHLKNSTIKSREMFIEMRNWILQIWYKA